MSAITPDNTQYDYGLGINTSHIDYIKQSLQVSSRISSTRCYLLFQNPSGSIVGSTASPFTISAYSETSPNYKTIIWSSGDNFPDIRPYTNNNLGSIFVEIDGAPASRVLEEADLLSDNEFAVEQRDDLTSRRVELIFNAGFNASAHVITYYYYTMNNGIDPVMQKRGDSEDQSRFGWTQYLNNAYDDYQGKHQILVRLPLVTRDIIINEEGKVALEDNDSWMVSTPYVHDFDILIIPTSITTSGVEERYEIINKRDSVIQGRLVSQRFKLKLIELSDARYDITYVTV